VAGGHLAAANDCERTRPPFASRIYLGKLILCRGTSMDCFDKRKLRRRQQPVRRAAAATIAIAQVPGRCPGLIFDARSRRAQLVGGESQSIRPPSKAAAACRRLYVLTSPPSACPRANNRSLLHKRFCTGGCDLGNSSILGARSRDHADGDTLLDLGPGAWRTRRRTHQPAAAPAVMNRNHRCTGAYLSGGSLAVPTNRRLVARLDAKPPRRRSLR